MEVHHFKNGQYNPAKIESNKLFEHLQNSRNLDRNKELHAD